MHEKFMIGKVCTLFDLISANTYVLCFPRSKSLAFPTLHVKTPYTCKTKLARNATNLYDDPNCA